MNLKENILEVSKYKGIDPYTKPFKPSDLGLNSSKYGSFSDYCSKDETKSGKYNKSTILKVAERNKSNKPYKYLLITDKG